MRRRDCSSRVAREGWCVRGEHVGVGMRRRVVVTGLGVVSPIGNSVHAFEENLKRGVSGVRPISIFNAGALPSRIAGEVTWTGPIARDRKQTFAVEAARQAI